jgi:DNA-directed RNA polymerase subunit H (RpoH/RPB5)
MSSTYSNKKYLKSLYEKYKNVLLMLKRRKYNIVSEQYGENDFIENYLKKNIYILSSINNMYHITHISKKFKSFVKKDISIMFSDIKNIIKTKKIEKINKIIIIMNKKIGKTINKSLISELKNIQFIKYENIQLIELKRFHFDILKHKYSPDYIKILSSEEKKTFELDSTIKINTLPKILSSDVISIYYGLVENDIIKIISKYEEDGISSVTYFHVVNNS